MSEKWIDTTVGELADWKGGLTPSLANKTYWEGGEIPWISSKEVVGGVLSNTKRKVTPAAVEGTSLSLTQAGSVVVVVRSGILLHTFPVAYVPFPTTVNQDVKIASPVAEVEGRFLAYLLESLSIEVLQRYRKTGTTVQSIDVSGLLSHPVRRPPLVVQRRIMDLIAHLDNHLTNLRAERNAASSALITACMTLTDPRGRESRLLPEVANVLDSKRVPINEMERATRPGNVPYYGANGQVGWIDESLFDEPLVLVAEDGGPVAEWRSRPQAYTINGPAWVNNHAHVLRATMVSRDWLYYSLRHRDLTAYAPVGTRSKLTQASLRQLLIATYPGMESREAEMKSLEQVVEGLTSEINSLTVSRSAMLNDLLTGSLSIPIGYDSILTEVA